MKVNYYILPFIFSVILIGSLTPAYAQEETDPTINELKESTQNSDNSNDDRASVYEDRNTTHYRDSLHMRVIVAPVIKVKSSDQAKPSSANKEDDALSFNFLYYIIQKFKISDLVDE